MSSAHYFFRNYDIKQVLNLMCYMTEFPHTLTSTQKITRMYRYNLFHLVACSEEKKNGQSTKIDAILMIITGTFKSLEKNWRFSLTYQRVQLFLPKHSRLFNNELEIIWTQQ